MMIKNSRAGFCCLFVLFMVAAPNWVGADISVSPATFLAAGFYHTVGVKADGTVAATGANDDTQLNVSGWSGITQVAAADGHTVGLKYDGTVVAVGDNGWNQCNVGDWSGITQVAAGAYHTVGTRRLGNLIAPK